MIEAEHKKLLAEAASSSNPAVSRDSGFETAGSSAGPALVDEDAQLAVLATTLGRGKGTHRPGMGGKRRQPKKRGPTQDDDITSTSSTRCRRMTQADYEALLEQQREVMERTIQARVESALEQRISDIRASIRDEFLNEVRLRSWALSQEFPAPSVPRDPPTDPDSENPSNL